MKYLTGAGLILFIEESNKTKFCILVDNKNRFDFPKGALEKTEFPYDCALREAYEEANVEEKYFTPLLGTDPNNNFICGDSLVLYLCEFNPMYINNLRIKSNPENGVLEHKEILWLEKNEAQKNILSFMSKSLDWAERIILTK